MNRLQKIFWYFMIFASLFCFLYFFAVLLVDKSYVSLLWVWPFLGGMLFFCAFLGLRRSSKKYSNMLNRVHSLLCMLLCMFALTFGALLVGVFSYENTSIPSNVDAIIVLGAGLNKDIPSPVLKKRIEEAAVYLRGNKNTFVVATGARGDDETVSEACAIKRELISLGIEENRIILEESSTTTAQNIQNAFALMPKNVQSVGIVTTDYHVFRSVATAKSNSSFKIYSIAVEYSYILKPHYIIREYITFIVDVLLGNIRLSKAI